MLTTQRKNFNRGYRNSNDPTKSDSKANLPVLRIINSGPGGTTTNYFDWKEYALSCFVVNTTAGSLPRAIMNHDEFNLKFCAPEDNLDLYPIRKKHDTSKDVFIPTEEQWQVILSFNEKAARDLQKMIYYRDWKSNLEDLNVIIDTQNLDNTVKRTFFAKRKEERLVPLGQLISTLLASMTEKSREKVTAWKRSFLEREESEGVRQLVTDDGGTYASHYGMRHAYLLGDFHHIFNAAFHTHIIRIDERGVDPAIELLRYTQELEHLRSSTHTGGSFLTWHRNFMNSVKSLRACNKEIDDFELQSIYISCLNKKIFVQFIDQWSIVWSRKMLDINSFSDMETVVSSEYSRQLLCNAEVVKSVEQGATRTQLSMAVKEDSKGYGHSNKQKSGRNWGNDSSVNRSDAGQTGDKSCPICLTGMHQPTACHLYRAKYSVKDNVSFRAKQRADNPDKFKGKKRMISVGDDSSSRSDKKQTYWNGKKKYNSVNALTEYPTYGYLSFLERAESEQFTICNEDFSLYCNATQQLPKYIDFIFDTGSEASTISVKSSSILHGVYEEEATLVGYGGAVVELYQTSQL